jgi:hypothetical protein
MLPYATPAICAQLDPYEERERDTLRTAPAPSSAPLPRSGRGSRWPSRVQADRPPCQATKLGEDAGDIQGRWWSSTTHVDCPPGSAHLGDPWSGPAGS